MEYRVRKGWWELLQFRKHAAKFMGQPADQSLIEMKMWKPFPEHPHQDHGLGSVPR